MFYLFLFLSLSLPPPFPVSTIVVGTSTKRERRRDKCTWSIRKKKRKRGWIVSIRPLFRARATTSTVTLRVHQASSLNELLLVYLLFVHPFHMPRDVHLLLRPVHTVRALELGLLPALPLLMISQATLQLVHPSARRTIETLGIRGAGTEPFAQSAARPPHDRRNAPSLPGSRPL